MRGFTRLPLALNTPFNIVAKCDSVIEVMEVMVIVVVIVMMVVIDGDKKGDYGDCVIV